MIYDVIVVGARCAGSPLAMLLASKGYRVALVDRATFPSDVPHGHVILYRGVRFLRDWGLLERVERSNCPPIRHHTFDLGDFPLSGFPPAYDGIPGEIAPRRYVLDKLLVDAAIEAGAELRERCAVESLLWEGKRVTGIRYQTPTGAIAEEHARIVVGADGRHSRIARAVSATAYRERPSLTCGYYSYWSGVDSGGLEAHILPRPALALAFPTNDNLTCVAVQWPVAEFHAVRADIEKAFFAVLDLVPSLAARVRDGRREERFRGTADLPNYIRQAVGPGWALVGDAGAHKDPLLANGISDAFNDAATLAGALDSGLSGRESLDTSLATWERQRNATILSSYESSYLAASFPPPSPELLRLRAAIRRNQAAIDAFLGVGRGTTTDQEFARLVA
jgi:2-polyprenyl-6-methoxyphenol hydroxylase-like FAD-dependent oxidoreductase